MKRNESSAYDPFTGEARYVPGSDPNSKPKNGNGAQITPSTDLSVGADNPYFPVKNYICFENFKIGAIKKKILEFSQSVPPEVAVTNDDMDLLEELMDSSKEVTLKQIRLLKMMLSWPRSEFVLILRGNELISLLV